ncbi:response regulator transcription factor [Methylotetracoccus oryzae]|uniref:response regulator transcription factor n=1 Tax=Methylotetracoccus oryzae TaxID=1919059 RepID=UPI0013A53D0D|nr:response regulator [Methylotetracoccus oryzae]
MQCEGTVVVVDDDRDIRESMQWLVESIGLRSRAFKSAEDFLAHPDASEASCLLLDVRMPGMGGLSLLRQLQVERRHLPVIMLTAHGDIPMAVQAVKSGAFDFIEKPGLPEQILERVRDALRASEETRVRDVAKTTFNKLFNQLTEREQGILVRVVQGQSNKKIGTDLAISERTVEKHRESILKKMHTRSFAQVIRDFSLYRSGG